jgi:hypothetical protein
VLFGEYFFVRQPHNPFNAVVFALTFYTVVLPLMLRTILVLLPALWGMRVGRRAGTLPLVSTSLFAVAIGAMTAIKIRALQFSAILGWWHLGGRVYGAGLIDPGWQVRLLPLVVLWPVAYMVMMARRHYEAGTKSNRRVHG